MKVGIRKPNIKTRVKARTTGKIKRKAKKAVNPLYEKKGMGYINDPKKAVYNKVYNKTTTSVDGLVKSKTFNSDATDSQSFASSSQAEISQTEIWGSILCVIFSIIFIVGFIMLLFSNFFGVLFMLLGFFGRKAGIRTLNKQYDMTDEAITQRILKPQEEKEDATITQDNCIAKVNQKDLSCEESCFYDKEFILIQNRYYEELEKVENQWSVLYNLKSYNSDAATKYIQLCRTNIEQFIKMDKCGRQYKDYNSPLSVPAYKRLSMLYEKQEKYKEAYEVCIEAIQAGAEQDGTKSGMKGRAARMIKKSGITPNDETMKLLIQ